MELFNIGPLELIIFLVIAFLVLGPKGMILTAYKIGKWIREMVRSPMWREILNYSQEIRELPKKIMDETGLEAELKAVRETTNSAMKEVNSSLKEVSEAARVPEAEHIRLETGQPDSPASTGKITSAFIPPAAPPTLAALAAQELTAAQEASTVQETQVAGQPIPAEQIVPATQIEPAATELPAETPAMIDPIAERRDAIDGQAEGFEESPAADVNPELVLPEATEVQPVEPATEPPVAELPVSESLTPTPRKRASRKRSTEGVDTPTAEAANLETPTNGALPALVEEPAAPRKRASRKRPIPEPVDSPTASSEPAMLDVAVSADNELELAPGAGLPSVVEQEAPAPLTIEQPAMLTPEVEPVVEPQPAPRKRAVRKAKPVDAEPIVSAERMVSGDVPQANGNGHEGNTAEPQAKPARRPRKPRVVEE